MKGSSSPEELLEYDGYYRFRCEWCEYEKVLALTNMTKVLTCPECACKRVFYVTDN